MIKLISFGIASLFAVNLAFAQPAAGGCEARAMSKEGKPLHGAAKAAFVKKCVKDNPGLGDEKSAAKSAQQEKMKSCNAEAKGKKGQERKDFMKGCLSK